MDQKVVQKIGKYEIVAELGQGGMGVVYKARDPFIGRLVALKTITPELVSDPEILKRFYREAQSAGTLQHPNIVTIYDLGEAEGRPYIAMEFVEGESLQSIINRRARIPLAAKLKLVQQFCEGLDHAHKHGFVHRDVKPANILVTNEGVVKVVDFGIVHLESTNLTKTGMFLGTIHYASPEQINDGRVDSRSDLWSVTAVVYEFIAYKKAFDGSNIAAIIAKVLSAEPEPLSRICPGVPVELDQVISKGLKKNIDERYQSLDEMLGGLLPIARSLQLTFIGDLLIEAKDLRDKGDYNGAQEKVRAVLILDNTHAEAKRLYSEVASEIHRVGPAQRAKKLVSEAEQAFTRGEFGEAIKMLTEAEGLNPADTQARNLKEKALREQEHQRELQEAFTDGQKSMKQGDLTTAERAFNRVLQLDQNHPQAAALLQEIREDRHRRERDFRLKEVLWETDNLVSAGKYEEAQGRLLEIQQEFPNAEEIAQKLQALDPLVRSHKLVEVGQRALEHGEYGEAVRALTEALEINPQDVTAHDLKERAVQERDRLRQVREALGNGQRAMRQGDQETAEREFQKVLQLDPANTQATALIGQVRQSLASREREEHFRAVIQQAEQLASQGKLEDAQHTLMELQQDFPDSNEIHLKLQKLDQQMKVASLLAAGQQAFDQGEFGEAVRILTEAQGLDAGNPHVRDLRTKAAQERDRLRQMREAISAGQKAMRAGDAALAEREFQRALQLDPNNSQAKSLLDQVQKDRPAHALDDRGKEILAQAERLMARKKFDEARRKLKDLQRAYPDSEEVKQKIQELNDRKSGAAAPAPPAEPPATAGPPLSEAAKSMQLAEELRRSLQTPRAAEPPPAPKMPAPEPAATIPIAQAPPLQAAPVQTVQAQAPPVQATPFQTPPTQAPALPALPPEAAPLQATQVTESPAAVGGDFSATSMMPTLKSKAPAAPEVTPPPEPPARKAQTPPPSAAMLPAQVEVPKRPAPAPAPPRATPSPAAIAHAEAAKKPPMIMIAAIVLVIIMAIGGFMIFHKSKPAETTTTAATNTTSTVNTQNSQQQRLQQEQTLFEQANAARDNKQWDDAIDKYGQVTKMAEDGDPLKEQAIAAISAVNKQKQGIDPAKLEKQTFSEATSALNKKEYARARGLFSSVLQFKVPDSTLAPQAQAKIDEIDKYLNVQSEFEAAENAASHNQLDGAIAQFNTIAEGGGPFAAKAKARASELQKMKAAAASNQELASAYNEALKAENNNDLNGALERFKAIVGKGEPFGTQAQDRIKEINQKLAIQNADRDWNAATAAEGSDPQGALKQLQAIAGRPGPHQEQAQAEITTLNNKLAAAADDAKFQEAVKKQNSGDLKGAAEEFKSLLGRRPDAADKYAAVVAAMAAANAPKAPEPPKAVVNQPPAPSTSTSTSASVRTPTVTPLSGGDPKPYPLPWHKGVVVPDYNVDGGLQPAGPLTVPPMKDAPANSICVLKITVDESGNVTPNQIITDNSGYGPDVQRAARSWKFKPPTAKGKPVQASMAVRITF